MVIWIGQPGVPKVRDMCIDTYMAMSAPPRLSHAEHCHAVPRCRPPARSWELAPSWSSCKALGRARKTDVYREGTAWRQR